MRYDTIITGGTVVSDHKQVKTDIAIRGERIEAVGDGLAKEALAKRTSRKPAIVDATGKLVLPGVIDVHVHLDMPFCGTVSSDDYDSGTRAAARGGVTTVIDFAIPYGKDSLQDAVDKWFAKAAAKACVDYSFHACLTDAKRHIREIPAIIKRGIPTFKEFMIYASQGWQSDDAAIFETLEATREHGGLLLVHAESSRVLDVLIDRHHNKTDMKKYGARLHPMTRPNYIEAEAIQRVIKWTEVTGSRLYIVHMSTGDGADLVLDARDRGVKVIAETCAQYLVLDESVFGHKDGHLYATCPQLKTKRDQLRLWKGLKRGEVAIISTDTCTFTREQKAMWEGDWTKIPMGMPGLETLLPIVYTYGVQKDWITLEEMVAKLCANPARVMGMYPRKGALIRHSDADIIIMDPEKTSQVNWSKMETNADWSPYQGWTLAGFPEKTFSRGRLVVDNYEFIGENGWGRFVEREAPGLV